MDQGPMAYLKKKYRCEMLRDILDANETIPVFQKKMASNVKYVIDKCARLWTETSINFLNASRHKLCLNREVAVTL